jgi:hypothetical protein
MNIEEIIKEVRKKLTERNFKFTEKEEDKSLRFNVKHNKEDSILKVYSTGTILIQGKECDLKSNLTQIKDDIESDGQVIVKEPTIDELPQSLFDQCDIFNELCKKYLDESIRALRNKCYLSSAITLGVCSEIIIRQLFEAFCAAIEKEANRNKAEKEIINRQISKAYDEFKRKYNGSTPKPNEVSAELEKRLEALYNFFRLCRNEAGHPNIDSDISGHTLIGVHSMFYKYTLDLQKIVNWYRENKINL